MSGKYHFIGIGGVGMSALAEAALKAGMDVTGSDRLIDAGGQARVLDALRAQGAVLFPQDGSGIDAETVCVVVSTAIEADNPDLLAAGKRKIEVMHRSNFLDLILRGRGRRIAVGGTCGKSTVTALTGWLLQQAGMDPTVINGAPLAEWISDVSVGSSRVGDSGLCVFEADESDRSLMNLECDIAVVTNASADHFDLQETHALFDSFIEKAVEGAVDARADVFWSDVVVKEGAFDYQGHTFTVTMPGRHNVLNAVVSVKVCQLLGCDSGVLAENLGRFKGVSRRLEFVGRRGGVSVYDDYAHNTEKIRASWEALASRYKPLVVVWRPHGYGPLRVMMDDLAKMFKMVFRDGDSLLVLPVYDAGGTADRTVNSDSLVQKLLAAGCRAELVATIDAAQKRVLELVAEGSAVAVMGARDPALPVLASRILASLHAGGHDVSAPAQSRGLVLLDQLDGDTYS